MNHLTLWKKEARAGILSDSDLERFIAKILSFDGCWIWERLYKKKGYGYFYLNKKNTSAHRLSYRLFVGEIPKELQIDHLCRNRACVNPKHLEAVTPRENTLRGEGISSVHSRKTECIYGHPFSGDNLRMEKRGRVCITCHKATKAKSVLKKKAALELLEHPTD